MTDPNTPDDAAVAKQDEEILGGPLPAAMEGFADHLSHSHVAQEAGSAVMPGFHAHVNELLSDLDAEAAADKAMLDGMPAAFHDHPPLEATGIDLGALKGVDPSFDDEAFMTIARETFYKVREARSLETPEEGAALLSPAMESALSSAVSGDVASHRHHLLPLLEVMSAVITAAGVAEAKELITVRFHLTGEELDRDDSGKVVAGNTALNTWDEDWKFARDPAVDTSESDEKHILSFTDAWMVAHRGWVVTAIDRVAASPPS